MRTNTLASACVLACFALLTACESGDSNQLADVGECEETVTAVDLDEETDLGLSAQDLLDAAEGTWTDELVYLFEEATTELTFVVSYDGGEASYVTSEYVSSDDADIAPDCEDYVEVEVSVSLETADGRFAESWTDTVVGYADADPVLWNRFDPASLGGTFDPSEVTDEDYDEAEVFVTSTFADGSCSGEIVLQVSGAEEIGAEESGGEEGVAWASNYDVAGWPSENYE